MSEKDQNEYVLMASLTSLTSLTSWPATDLASHEFGRTAALSSENTTESVVAQASSGTRETAAGIAVDLLEIDGARPIPDDRDQLSCPLTAVAARAAAGDRAVARFERGEVMTRRTARANARTALSFPT